MPIASWSSTKGSTSTGSAKPTTGRLAAWGPGNEPDNPTPDQLVQSRKQQADDAAKQAAAAKQKQGTSLFNKVKNFTNDNLVKPTVQTGEKVGNTAAAGVAGVVGLTTAGVQAAKGNTKGAKQTIEAANKEAGDLLDKGAGGAGGYLTSKQAQSSGDGVKGYKDNFVKPTLKAVNEVGPYVIPVGKAAEAGSLVEKAAAGLPGVAGKAAKAVATSKGIIPGVVRSATANGVLGGVTNAGDQALTNGKVDPRQVLNAAKQNAEIGTVMHVGDVSAEKGVNLAGKVTDKLASSDNKVVNAVQAATSKVDKTQVTNAKVNSLLDRVRSSQGAEPEIHPEPTLPQPGEVITPTKPELDPNTAKALQDTMATVHQPKAALEADAAKQAATEAAGKQSEQAAKDAEKATADTKKIDQQLEVYDAKAKDAKDGKLSNVDQVKVKQLKEQKTEIAKTVPEQPTVAADTASKPTSEATASVVPESTPARPEAAKSTSEASSTKDTPVAASEQKANTGADRGTSKIAQSVQEKAVARGLKNTFGEAGGYDKLTIKDQDQKAVALTNNREALDKVISGEKPLPAGLRATALIKAVEEHPVLGKDPEIIRRLSQAEHLTGESSRSAQELRLAAERSDHSPVEAARQIRKVREAAVERKTGKTAAKATTEELKQIRSAKAAATPKVTRQTFAEFVDSIRC